MCKYSHLSIGDVRAYSSIDAGTCCGCGSPIIYKNLRQKYLGHFVVDGLKIDKLEILDSLTCPGCGFRFLFVELPCGSNGHYFELSEIKQNEYLEQR